MLRAILLPAAVLATGTTPSLTYRIDWSVAGSGEPLNAAVVPVDGMPSAHPKVTGTVCGESYAPGAPIPAMSQWSNGGRSTPGGDCRTVTSGEMFYAYNYPSRASSNTGYSLEATMSIYMIVDVAGDAYMVMSNDIAGSRSSKNIRVRMRSNLGGRGARVIVADDGGEVTWNSGTGTGLGRWSWAPCCTDGGVIGPLPTSAFWISFFVESRHSRFTHLEFNSWNAGLASLDRRRIPFDQLRPYTDGIGERWHFRLEGFTTTDYCASFVTCGECTAQPNCAMCGGTCQLSSATCALGLSYTAQGTCCGECGVLGWSSDACIGAPGCGWCRSENTCISGTAQSSCRACSDGTAAAFYYAPPAPPSPPSPPIAPGGANGDPHLTLPHGGKADFRGEHRSLFNFLSAKNLALNVMTETADFELHPTNHTRHKDVHGSFLTQAHIIARTNTSKMVRVSFWAEMIAQQLNPIGLPMNLAWANGTVDSEPAFVLTRKHQKQVDDVLIRTDYSSLHVLTPEFEIVVTPQNFRLERNVVGLHHRLDIKLFPRVAEDAFAVPPHGIIGQGWDGDGKAIDGEQDAFPVSGEFTTYAMAKGAIEGVPADYKVATPYATDFKYSRFDATSAEPRNVAKLVAAGELNAPKAAYGGETVGSSEITEENM